MNLTFVKLKYGEHRGAPPGRNIVYMNPNHWDDFGFKTQFSVTLCGDDGTQQYIGEVKIGHRGQSFGWTADAIPETFHNLPPGFFSLGQDVDYYEKIFKLPLDIGNNIISSLVDIASADKWLNVIKDELVFLKSLTRQVSYSVIGEQFRRVLNGGTVQTPYNFVYKVQTDKETADFELRFDVSVNAKPSTNIHVLIGRNGIGKTTLLNGMISAIVKNHQSPKAAGHFWDVSKSPPIIASERYFSSLISVSFSAFDPFTPPIDSDEATNDVKYFYVGLKRVTRNKVSGDLKSEHKDIEMFSIEFATSLSNCFNLPQKRRRWVRAIRFLESDDNFAEMDLTRFAEEGHEAKLNELKHVLFKKMSSGHAIVLLTITKLVEKIDEKALVLMDEPESHLHPPLLSAFTRALADLLNNRNAVAIIATHSPVVLQEVPKQCVWKLRRNRLLANADRPEGEIFGENVGILTREVFQLEVSKSGFHALLAKSVAEGKTADEILSEYQRQIGFEGKAILLSLIAARGAGV
jgi:predicted ATPase